MTAHLSPSEASKLPPPWKDDRRAKLSWGQVMQIRERRRLNEKVAALAAEFGVTSACISMVARELRWRGR